MSECKICKGRGIIKCSICKGNKAVYRTNLSDRNIIYPEYYRVEQIKCPYCNGEGYMKCSNCNGTGEE